MIIEETKKEKLMIFVRFLRMNLYNGLIPLISGIIIYYLGYFFGNQYWFKFSFMFGGAALIIYGAVNIVLNIALRKDINILRRIAMVEKLKNEAWMNRQEFFLSSDEDEIIDLKRERISSEKIAKLIVAFANRFGGIIVFGVDDEKNVYPIDTKERDIIANQIENICLNNLEPTIKPDPIPMITNNDKGILVIFIPRARREPIRIKKDNIYYQRVGRSNKKMNQEEIKKFRKIRF